LTVVQYRLACTQKHTMMSCEFGERALRKNTLGSLKTKKLFILLNINNVFYLDGHHF